MNGIMMGILKENHPFMSWAGLQKYKVGPLLTKSQSWCNNNRWILQFMVDINWTSYPLVNCHITMENHHGINGKTHYFNGHCFNSYHWGFTYGDIMGMSVRFCHGMTQGTWGAGPHGIWLMCRHIPCYMLYLVGGWATYQPLWKISWFVSEFVSWDDDIPFPRWWESHVIQPCSSHHQPNMVAWCSIPGIPGCFDHPKRTGGSHLALASSGKGLPFYQL